MLRSWATPPNVVALARRACGRIDALEPMGELEREVHAALVRVEERAGLLEQPVLKSDDAWSILALRDDLESVTVALGAALRLSTEATPPAVVALAARLENTLFRALLTLDRSLETAGDALADALAAHVDETARAGILAVRRDADSGPWIALVLGAKRSGRRPFAVQRMDDHGGRTPSVRLGRELFSYASPATAAADDEILEALEAGAASEPVARLDEGRVLVRVCAPSHVLRDPERPSVAGLSIESSGSFERIVEVRVDAGGMAAPTPRRIAPIAWWISLGPLSDAGRFVVTVRTDRGEFACAFDAPRDPAP